MAKYLIFFVFIWCATVPSFVFPQPTCKTCPDTCQRDPWQGGKFGNPGAKFRLNENAVTWAYNIANQRMTEYMKKISLTDVKLGDLSINKLKVNDFKTTHFTRSLDPLFFIKWGFNQGDTVIQGNFSQVDRNPPTGGKPGTTDTNTGVVTIISNYTSMDISITLYKDVDGKPTFLSMICDAKLNISKTGITFNPPMNITESTRIFIVNQIQNSFESSACELARLLMAYINKQLKTLPVAIKLSDDDLTLDYSLTELIKFERNNPTVEGSYKGAVYVKSPSTYPFYPPTIDNVKVSNGSMLEFYLTDYTLNTLFFAAHKQGLLNFSVNPQYMSNASAILLRLPCKSDNCVGSIYPNLASFGPKAYVALSMYTTEPPKAKFDSSESYWLGKGKVEMRIVDDSNVTKLFTATSSCIYGTLTPKVAQNTVFATTSIKFLDLNIVDSPAKTLTSQDITTLQSAIIKILEELVNGFLSVGFPIPLVNGVSLSNPKLQLIPGAVFVSSDLSPYTLPNEDANSPTKT